MRVPVAIEPGTIFVSGDDEAIAKALATFMATQPSPSLREISDWCFDRGLHIGVDMEPRDATTEDARMFDEALASSTKLIEIIEPE